MHQLRMYILKYLPLYIFGFACLLAAIVLDMFNPKLLQVVIDDVIMGKQLGLLPGALGGLMLIALSRAVLGYAKEYSLDVVSSRIEMELRRDLFNHIQALSFSFFDQMNTGELMSRIKEDIGNIWSAICYGIAILVEQAIYFVAAVIILFALNWKLAVTSLLTMPIIGVMAIKLEKEIGRVYEEISDQGAVLNTTAQENLAGIRLVKAFAREKYEIEKFGRENRKNFALHLQQAKVLGRYDPRIEFWSNVTVVLVTTVGGILVIRGEMTVGSLVAFGNYIYMLIWPMRLIGWLTNIVAQAHASLKKVDALFAEEPAIKNPLNPVMPNQIAGHITFKDVSLEYNGLPVLKNISFDVRPGKTLAIMGATGAGKSCLVQLIGRYYDCTSGQILIDGVDIKKLDLKKLRDSISFVMQDVFLFSDTIEANIKFGARNVTPAEFFKAVQDAKVDEFVEEMPDGYETVIGERGLGLSGGQKQRIAIARALVKKGSILIFDDSTSALDMETEYAVQRAIEKRHGITKVIIAHRVSAVKNADEIIVLENGEIVERGTHETLLKLKGRYYQTYQEQVGSMLVDDVEEAV